MSKFKSGDKVIRIGEDIHDVIKGKSYIVKECFYNCLTLQGVRNRFFTYSSCEFKLFDEVSKPPLGIIPYNLFLESLETDLKETEKVIRDRRKADLQEAVKRYGEDGKDIPYEWVKELMGEV